MGVRILIMGLPGAGKTTLAGSLKKYIETNSSIDTRPTDYFEDRDIEIKDYHSKVDWLNADEIRRKYNDWDFSREGRIRQSLRMLEFALECKGDYVICDFVAPLPEMRNNFKADWTIWVDTIEAGRYEDTNKVFVPPNIYDFRVTEKNAIKWSSYIGEKILHNQRRPRFNWRKESVLLLGRYQPWHTGHRALFERALEKTGQVVIQVRDCHGWNNGNPFDFEKVKDFIRRDLDPLYQGQYEIILVPNIVNITYGRDVGYKIEQEVFDDNVHSISATKIRKEMGL